MRGHGPASFPGARKRILAVGEKEALAYLVSLKDNKELFENNLCKFGTEMSKEKGLCKHNAQVIYEQFLL